MSKAHDFVDQYNKLSTPNQDAHDVAMQQLSEALGEISSSELDTNDGTFTQIHTFDDGSRAKTRLMDDESDDGDDESTEFFAELLEELDNEDPSEAKAAS